MNKLKRKNTNSFIISLKTRQYIVHEHCSWRPAIHHGAKSQKIIDWLQAFPRMLGVILLLEIFFITKCSRKYIWINTKKKKDEIQFQSELFDGFFQFLLVIKNIRANLYFTCSHLVRIRDVLLNHVNAGRSNCYTPVMSTNWNEMRLGLQCVLGMLIIIFTQFNHWKIKRTRKNHIYFKNSRQLNKWKTRKTTFHKM